MIEGKDIFRLLIIRTCETSDALSRQNNFYSQCSLCGDKESGICSGCITSLSNLDRLQKKEIYSHLKDIGDKTRAAKLETFFEVFPRENNKIKIKAPTKDNPNNIRVLDLARLKKKLGLNQKEIAKKIKVSNTILSKALTEGYILPNKVNLAVNSLTL